MEMKMGMRMEMVIGNVNGNTNWDNAHTAQLWVFGLFSAWHGSFFFTSSSSSSIRLISMFPLIYLF